MKTKIFLLILISVAVSSFPQTLKNDPNSTTKSVSAAFETFLTGFINTCFIKNRLDSLLYVSSPLLKGFVHPDIGLYRAADPEGECLVFSFNFNTGQSDPIDWSKHPFPDLKRLKYYANAEPVEGFCRESPSKEGIYYKATTEFLNYSEVDEEGEYLGSGSFLPEAYEKNQLMKVLILNQKYVWTLLYFINADGKWWFLLEDNCDCSP